MLQDSIENSKGLKAAVQSNIYPISLQRKPQGIELAQNQQEMDDILEEAPETSSRGSLSSDSQQISTEDYSEAISLEQNIMTQHLICLEAMVFKISEKLFKITLDLNQMELKQQSYHQYEPSLNQYLLAHKSLIPIEFIQDFIVFLQRHESYAKALEWIYNHARPQLGDQMILIAHKSMLAYLPIRDFINSQQQITNLAQQPFNLHNIYNDSRLKMLNIGQLYPACKGIFHFNAQLYVFQQEFLQTLLLVLQQYFQNPGYASAVQEKQKRQRKLPIHPKPVPYKKTKRIQKNSRV